MHQGNKAIEARNRETALYNPTAIDFILVTHAHIDHSGLLPKMVKEGYAGPIYCTKATSELLDLMGRCADPTAPGWTGIGCAEALAHLQGKLSLIECRRLWLHNTRAYAKRQLTWFRARSEARLLPPDDVQKVVETACDFWRAAPRPL